MVPTDLTKLKLVDNKKVTFNKFKKIWISDGYPNNQMNCSFLLFKIICIEKFLTLKKSSQTLVFFILIINFDQKLALIKGYFMMYVT